MLLGPTSEWYKVEARGNSTKLRGAVHPVFIAAFLLSGQTLLFLAFVSWLFLRSCYFCVLSPSLLIGRFLAAFYEGVDYLYANRPLMVFVYQGGSGVHSFGPCQKSHGLLLYGHAFCGSSHVLWVSFLETFFATSSQPLQFPCGFVVGYHHCQRTRGPISRALFGIAVCCLLHSFASISLMGKH